MCGISAIIDHSGDAPMLCSALLRAHQMLAHRGPDGEAFLWVGRDARAHRLSSLRAHDVNALPAPAMAIGFHQLKIHDPSDDAVQPLGSADGRHWIVLNGEIYNAPALRSELRGRGHSFRSAGDTEVALAAYREWGTGCFERFNGMWAILIIDLERRTLVGSRDRLGIKPLYYAVDPDRLTLASEPQAVGKARGAAPAFEGHRISEFLAGFPPQSGRETFFRGIKSVPAASVYEINFLSGAAVEPSFRLFWDLHASVPSNQTPSFDEARNEVRARLQSAVALQSSAAVPVGCLLSGGLDTSLLALTVGDHRRSQGAEPAPVYSIYFDEPDMSELPFIWSVVRKGGLSSHTFELTAPQAWADVDAVVRTQGQPLLGQELIAQYRAYQLARDNGSVVVLEGQGPDELLAGMPTYAAHRFDELWSTMNVRELLAELWADSRARGRSAHIAAAHAALAFGRIATGRKPSPVPAIPAIIDVDALQWNPPADDGWQPSRDPSLLNQYLFRLVTRTNIPTVLQAQDRSSMAHGVESRVPYLDHRFVEYCFTLPSSYKVQRGQRKRVLREVARGVVPDVVLQRRDKKTFVSKIHWMPLRERYAGSLRDMASSTVMQQSPWLRSKVLVTFVEDYIAGRHDDLLAVWRLYTLWRWLELFEVRH